MDHSSQNLATTLLLLFKLDSQRFLFLEKWIMHGVNFGWTPSRLWRWTALEGYPHYPSLLHASQLHRSMWHRCGVDRHDESKHGGLWWAETPASVTNPTPQQQRRPGAEKNRTSTSLLISPSAPRRSSTSAANFEARAALRWWRCQGHQSWGLGRAAHEAQTQ